MGSTDQADPSCFYFRISWVLMERLCFYFFCPLDLLQALGSLKNWLLQKLSMKIFDQKFRFLIKKQVFLCFNISRTWIFWTKIIKSTAFHQYSWNSEVETTWISLIGWHHTTSIAYTEGSRLMRLLGPGKSRISPKLH